ncbi:rhomboid family intramembrane serine protease [Brevundimonas sp. 2R-24]|uniref:Rhomboid family intramembrane serine protease n=1 Tax=Peiella sedimenti TaxID=3061083 RepID=A0ABT8SIC0_9CAUL|nr:rhomboid family intramembrane serine protease [Caulobacteraceae bacterium XZ-24]
MPWIQAEPPPPPRREPMLNAPWVSTGLALALGGLFLLQLQYGDPARLDGWTLIPAAVLAGDWWRLISSILLHADWGHVVMNALGVFIFGAPVARRMGRGAGGGVGLILFFLICGVLAGVGYTLVHAGSDDRLVGASGAVFGLVGASIRLEGGDSLRRLTDRRVLGMSLAWTIANLIAGFLTPDRSIAWEAHLFGLAAGLLLIGPWLRLTPRPRLPDEAI